MPVERKGLINFAGEDATVIGVDLEVGQFAPEFTARAIDWSLVKGIESTSGKVRIIGSLPSLSTSVCDRETRRFNQEAASLGDEIAILMLSMDLPFTQRNWCAAAGIERVTTLSDYMNGEFGEKYGVLLKDYRVFRRAIFVVGRDDKFVYVEYLPAIGNEPDYDAVLRAARVALG
ncbi:MAG: thiol peroxidase [Anaerolineales bacterium]|nr:MAG: thiol peroxidase [Anaerolineales bacterium]